MTTALVKSIKKYKDFPKKGIMFYDLNPIYADKKMFLQMITLAHNAVLNLHVPFDYVVGIESRGFILGTAIAEKEFKGFIPIRKPNKLAGTVHSVTYKLEYGTETLQLQNTNTLRLRGKSVLLVDDVLATGGTLNAAIQLLRMAKVKNIIVLVALDIGICKTQIKSDYRLTLLKV